MGMLSGIAREAERERALRYLDKFLKDKYPEIDQEKFSREFSEYYQEDLW